MTTLRNRISALLGMVSGWLERRAWIVVPVIMVIYLAAAFQASREKPLWHDELYTLWIAQAPTLGAMWQDVRTWDLNPPLVYVLTRWSLKLFGVSTLATRLPEIIGFLMALLCVFRLVQRRMGVLFGAFAAMLLLESDIFQLATDARPYGVMFGFLGLVLVSYQEAADEEVGPWRWLWSCVLCFGVAGMLASHIFSVLALAGVIAAEAWRTWQRRQAAWAIWTALLAPVLLVATYLPMLRGHGQGIFPPAFQPDGDTIFTFYMASIDREIVALCLTYIAILLFAGPRLQRTGPGMSGLPWFFSGAEWIAIGSLLAGPLPLMGFLMWTHGAFFPRYGATAIICSVVLAAVLLARWTLQDGWRDERAALLGAVIVFAMSGLGSAIPEQIAARDLMPTAANSEPKLKACEACRTATELDASLPLVDASGLTFIEMQQREQAELVSRLYYLTDAGASRQYAHANIFERMPQLVEHFHLRGHAEAYMGFVREHPHFFVFGRYDYPEDWLLRKLTADGASIRVVGRTSDDYRDTELYEVTIRQ